MHNAVNKFIEQWFESFAAFIFNNAWKTLFVMALIVGGLVSQLPNLKMDTSTEGFLREDDPVLLQYNAFREQFGRDELVLVAVTGPKVFEQKFLEKLKRLHDELETNVPYLDDITSLINARNTRGAEGELIVEDLLENWPEDAVAMAEIRDRAMANPVYKNMLLSEDGSITTIVLRSDAYSSEGAEGDILDGFDDDGESGVAFDDEPGLETPLATASGPPMETRPFLTDAENSELVAKVRGIAAKYVADDFKIYVAGSPVVSHVLKGAMQSNMRRFTLLAILMIGVVLFLLFRRISGVLLPVVTVVLSLLSTLGLMALMGFPIKLPTQIMPSFLLAVGVGDSVHILAIFFHRLKMRRKANESVGKFESRDAKKEAVVHSLGHSGLAVVMTSLTTAAGLASLSGAEIAPISDMGIIAAMGVMIALFYTVIFIPAVLSVLPIKNKSDDSFKAGHVFVDRLLDWIADFSTRRSGTVLIISAIALIVGITGAVQVKFSHKPFEWLPMTEPARQATEFMDKNMKGASSVEIVVDTGMENGLYEPHVMKALDQLRVEVEAIDRGELFVGKTLSLADILKESNKALNENREEFYVVPDDRLLIAQELFLFENSGSDDMNDFVDSQFRQARFIAKMPWVDAVFYEDFINELKGKFKSALGGDNEIYVTGMAALLGRTMHATIASMAKSYVIAGFVITLMMILLIGNFRIGLISMLPNLLPIVLTVGVMGWLGMPMDLFTMLIGSIAIGLAVDDTIHFMHNYRRYHMETGSVEKAVHLTLTSTGRAMFITSIVLSSGFFLYMFSSLSNLFNFGLLTGFTIIMALLADFFMAPALMAQLHRSHVLSDDGEY